VASVWPLFGTFGPDLCHPEEMNLQRTAMHIARQEIRLQSTIVNIVRQLREVRGQAQALQCIFLRIVGHGMPS